GRYEHSVVFADKIAFPNGVMPWNGGILVTAAPDILFFKDNDGDGRADERRVIITGFAEGNQQLRVNGLYWGLDNWIYGANGRSDGEVHWVELVELRRVAPRTAAQRYPVGLHPVSSAAERGGVVAARQPLPLNTYPLRAGRGDFSDTRVFSQVRKRCAAAPDGSVSLSEDERVRC